MFVKCKTHEVEAEVEAWPPFDLDDGPPRRTTSEASARSTACCAWITSYSAGSLNKSKKPIEGEAMARRGRSRSPLAFSLILPAVPKFWAYRGPHLPCTRIFENSKKNLRRAPFKKYFRKWQAAQKRNLHGNPKNLGIESRYWA